MFDVDRFVEDCYGALNEAQPDRAARELVAAAVSDPQALMHALGEPERAGVFTLHRSERLTVLKLIWGPGMDLMPHDHRMWAAIGIYTGLEDNTFWRRGSEGLERLGTKSMEARDATWLADSAIHSVRNPLDRLTGALHVYGGDFFGTPRSEWDPETLEEGPYDVEKNVRLFEESNRRLQSRSGSGHG